MRRSELQKAIGQTVDVVVCYGGTGAGSWARGSYHYRGTLVGVGTMRMGPLEFHDVEVDGKVKRFTSREIRNMYVPPSAQEIERARPWREMMRREGYDVADDAV